MNDNTRVKESVRRKYDEIARRGEKAGCACGCGPDSIVMIGDEYDGVSGYVADADLGLGCGMPTKLAAIEIGQTVLDLGSGAGLDAFVARKIVGESGRVIGVDMTESMIVKARENAAKLGYDNVVFELGDIENLPVESGSVDVVISNCVLNLVPDKSSAFAEMYRVLKPGAHFCVSDIVVHGELPESIRTSVELYAGCVAGALKQDEYLALIHEAGFADVEVAKVKVIDVPDEVAERDASTADLSAFKRNGGAIVSVTVIGVKR